LELKKIINLLESSIQNPSQGLPEDLFLFISRITPLINVDLLIKNEQNYTLLTWRDDRYYPPGWHIPGGIIRFKETIADRIKAVAKNELGAKVKFKNTPLAINEGFNDTRKSRGHFISLLYQCDLITQPNNDLRCNGNSPKQNEWMWHNTCPADIISVHEMYRKFF
jgi:ADP-ribose pyrophosphatase YjhB (NUDIX family)